MPFYHMLVDWGTPESGVMYFQKELDERIMSHIEAMNLVKGTLEFEIMNKLEFLEIDKLFNNAPN